MNSHKISNLLDPILVQDAATKNYVDSNVGISQATADTRYYLNTATLDTIVSPINNVSLATYKITNLGDATLATDALNRQTADGRYYANTVALNNITAPSADLSLNNKKITSLADAVSATDALN